MVVLKIQDVPIALGRAALDTRVLATPARGQIQFQMDDRACRWHRRCQLDEAATSVRRRFFCSSDKSLTCPVFFRWGRKRKAQWQRRKLAFGASRLSSIVPFAPDRDEGTSITASRDGNEWSILYRNIARLADRSVSALGAVSLGDCSRDELLAPPPPGLVSWALHNPNTHPDTCAHASRHGRKPLGLVPFPQPSSAIPARCEASCRRRRKLAEAPDNLLRRSNRLRPLEAACRLNCSSRRSCKDRLSPKLSAEDVSQRHR